MSTYLSVKIGEIIQSLLRKCLVLYYIGGRAGLRDAIGFFCAFNER